MAPDHQTLIIGAGLSGTGTGIRLDAADLSDCIIVEAKRAPGPRLGLSTALRSGGRLRLRISGSRTGRLMKPGTELAAVHPAVEAGVNNQDIDGLMALYAEDASMILFDGSIVTGLSGIREEWSGILAMNRHMTIRSRFAIAAGDLAVLSNQWTFEVDGEQLSSVTAEVARRQPDGGWLYVIDHPYAGSEPEELAAIMAAVDATAT